MEGNVPHRPITLEYPADTRAAWQPLKPEFSAACNALSLGMPYGEPYVMKAVRDALPAIEAAGDHELAARVRAIIDQDQNEIIERTLQHT